MLPINCTRNGCSLKKLQCVSRTTCNCIIFSFGSGVQLHCYTNKTVENGVAVLCGLLISHTCTVSACIVLTGVEQFESSVRSGIKAYWTLEFLFISPHDSRSWYWIRKHDYHQYLLGGSCCNHCTYCLHKNMYFKQFCVRNSVLL